MNKKEKRLSDYENSGQLGVTEMIGAIFFMLLGGCKRKYKYYYDVRYQKRNIITGYILGILLFVTGFGVFILVAIMDEF